MSTYLLNYGCTSAAGAGVPALWKGLCEGTDHRDAETGGCHWRARGGSSLDTLVSQLELAWKEAATPLSLTKAQGRWGVILASTKGHTEDVIWSTREALTRDPMTPVLDTFLERVSWKPARKLCVSNACASAHGALFLGKHWLEQRLVDHVLLLAADEAGRFVTRGFRSLGALSATKVRPFGSDRDGLQLGEAAAALIFSSQIRSALEVEAVEIETEGTAVTRPSSSGKSLLTACLNALKGESVDFIIAHGTATRANDAAEDRVFRKLFPSHTPLITGTKWSVGHTLGASGAVDLIAAAEVLTRQKAFHLANTPRLDGEFAGNYALPGKVLPTHFRRGLITSLGFGGAYAAAILKRSQGV